MNDEFGPERSCLELTKLPDVYIEVSVCFTDSEEGRDLLNFVHQSDIAKLSAEVTKQALEDLKTKAPKSRHRNHHLPYGSGIFLISH